MRDGAMLAARLGKYSINSGVVRKRHLKSGKTGLESECASPAVNADAAGLNPS